MPFKHLSGKHLRSNNFYLMIVFEKIALSPIMDSCAGQLKKVPIQLTALALHDTSISLRSILPPGLHSLSSVYLLYSRAVMVNSNILCTLDNF
jgi:hypothetical protein